MRSISVAIPRLELFGQEQCETIHNASLEILRRTGVRVHHQAALDLLGQADTLITETNLVRFSPALIEWALAQAPSRVVLCRRGSGEPAVRMEGMEVHFGPGSDCRHYLDPATGETRPFRTEDLVNCIRLVDALPEMDFCMSMGIPSELEARAPYRHQFALMLQHTRKPIVFISEGRADCEAIVAMAAAAAGGIEKLRLNPTLCGYSQVTTPLVHPEESLEKLLFMAEQSLPTIHQPSPMMGGTAPVTMAGALVVGNAEILSGLVIHQLKRPGAPFVYGSGQHQMDMRTTISVYGSPEFDLARVAVAEMARYYRLPHWGYAGCTDSCVMDEQAAADAVSSILVALLSGQHLAHDVGYLEAGMTTSPEMIVFSADTIARMRHFMGGISLDAESLAEELIHETGPAGEYLTSPHTLRHFRDLWQPALYSRQRRDNWVADGKRRLGDRLREKTLAVIESHRPESLGDRVTQEIEYILSQDKRL